MDILVAFFQVSVPAIGNKKLLALRLFMSKALRERVNKEKNTPHIHHFIVVPILFYPVNIQRILPVVIVGY